MARKEDDGLILQGDVYVRNRRIDGAGLVHIGNTTKLELSSSTEKKERISKQKTSYGQALDSISTPQPTTISFELDTFDRHNLALALMGKDADVSRAAADFSRDVVIGKKGQFFAIGETNLDPETAITVTANGTALDTAAFEINYNLGLVQIAANSSAISDGDTVTVAGKLKAQDGFKIDASVLNDWDLELILDGKNRVNEQEIRLRIPSAVIAADGAIDWFGDDFATAAFTGTVVKLAEESAPYTVEMA
ncbi:MAG: hypothetical protein IKZ88_05010 [Neisseriaceae bacterium]|nr:hypothetical protein [Neisseriaceae bacterium]